MSRKTQELKKEFGGLGVYTFKILVLLLMGRRIEKPNNNRSYYYVNKPNGSRDTIQANSISILMTKGYVKFIDKEVFITKTGFNLAMEKMSKVGAMVYDGVCIAL